MMLSIRTQDRMSLVPYDKQITISKLNQFNMVFDNGETLPLGIYHSKERALEVLDEIEQYVVGKILIPTDIIEHNYDDTSSIYNSKVLDKMELLPQVYVMPKE